MTLDIRYLDKGPEQIQSVRLATVYPHKTGSAPREIVIHFADMRGPQWIDLGHVHSITITND